MAKWKYQVKKKERPKESPYIYLPNDKPVEMTIHDWTFEKNPYNDSLFSCHVSSYDGEDVEKIWSVWDFDLKENLKKILKSKNINKDSVNIKVIKKKVDEVESNFEVNEVK